LKGAGAEIVIKLRIDHVCADGVAMEITRLVGPDRSVVDRVHMREDEVVCFTARTNFEDEGATHGV